MGKMVETLVLEHNELRRLLEQIQQRAVQFTDLMLLATLQESFLKKLEGHLLLENTLFYPVILEGMKQKNTPLEQVSKTQMFISEMKDIEMKVTQFFGAHKDEETIRAKKEEYLRGLEEIMSALIMRIETEEDSVYLMWDFFGAKE